jgi:hypothetical protein
MVFSSSYRETRQGRISTLMICDFVTAAPGFQCDQAIRQRQTTPDFRPRNPELAITKSFSGGANHRETRKGSWLLAISF